MDLRQQLETLNRMWMESYVKRDLAFLEQHVADEYVSTFPDGSVLDKKGEIAALSSGAVVLTDMRAREMTVQLYGEAAVITGQSTIEARVAGRDESGEYRDNRWVAVASQVTRIANP